MKTLTKEKFLEFLIKRDAYQSHLTWAKSQDTARDIIEKCPKDQYLHWLIWAIGGPMETEYDKKIDPLWSEYDKQVAPFRAEYEKNVVQLWGEYDKKETEIWAEYKKNKAALVREICTFERIQEEIGEQMKTLTKENLIKFLVEHGSHKSYLTWALTQVSARDIIEKCPNIDHLQWIIWSIKGSLWAEYREKKAPILAEYKNLTAPPWTEYKNQTAPLWAKYLEQIAPFWAKHLEQIDSLTREICTFERVQEAIGSIQTDCNNKISLTRPAIKISNIKSEVSFTLADGVKSNLKLTPSFTISGPEDEIQKFLCIMDYVAKYIKLHGWDVVAGDIFEGLNNKIPSCIVDDIPVDIIKPCH